MTVRPFAVALALCLFAVPAVAQSAIARADTLFRHGRVFAAESLYYQAVRRQPRDPRARLALGRYLAARGALKIGAVLMEEARYFGGDPKTVAAYLAPVYARLGDYKSLVALPGSPLPYADRSRAEWLRDNPPTVAGPDSGTIQYEPADSGAVGTIRLVIGRDTLEASIDAHVQGLVLDTSWIRGRETKLFASSFERDRRNFAAVTFTAAVGPFSLSNVITRFEPMRTPRRARVGLDLLGKLAPTFDPASRTITLRRSGRVADRLPGQHIPTLTYATGVWLVTRDGMWPLHNPHVHPLLRGARWTLNPRRGEIIAER